MSVVPWSGIRPEFVRHLRRLAREASPSGPGQWRELLETLEVT